MRKTLRDDGYQRICDYGEESVWTKHYSWTDIDAWMKDGKLGKNEVAELANWTRDEPLHPALIYLYSDDFAVSGITPLARMTHQDIDAKLGFSDSKN